MINWKIIGLCLILFPSLAWGTAYKSIYSYGLPRYYCSNKSCGDGNCKENASYCSDPSYPNRFKLLLTGWKYLYDPTNPKTWCGMDYPDVSMCPEESEKRIDFRATTLQTMADISIWTQKIDRFNDGLRIFIPPGTIYVFIKTRCPQDGRYGFVVRYKRPPECRYCNESEFDNVPWDRMTSGVVDLTQLAQRDYYAANLGGIAYLVPQRYYSTPLSVNEAGWVYVHKVKCGESGVIHQLEVEIAVDPTVYKEWYANVEPYAGGCVDVNHAQAGDKICWDSYGDPWTQESSGEVRVCSRDSLEYCDQSSCQNIGGFWYDHKCNLDPACTENNTSTCDSEEKCKSAGFYWYDNQCHVESKCREDISKCTQEECLDNAYYWYEDECHLQPACNATTIDLCDSEEKCESAGFYWYDEECRQEPMCAPQTVTACHSEEDCKNAGGYWQEGRCLDNICSPETPSACNQLECASVGCWYDNSCHPAECNRYCLNFCNATNCQAMGGIWTGTICKKPVCGPDNLPACNNPISCRGFNGEWKNGRCMSKLSSEIIPELQLEKTELKLNVNKNATVTITSGTPLYRVEVQNNLVNATVQGSQVLIQAFQQIGKDVVTIIDKNNKQARINIEVKAQIECTVFTQSGQFTANVDYDQLPVTVGSIAYGGKELELKLNVGNFRDNDNEARDVYLAFEIPSDPHLYVLEPDDKFKPVNRDQLSEIRAYLSGVSNDFEKVIFRVPSVCDSKALPEGKYNVYYFAVPAGTRISDLDWEHDQWLLLNYSFEINCTQEVNQ